MKKTIQLPNGSTVDCYQTATGQTKKALLYFHGGGLVYGTKNDLPEDLKQIFLKNNYEVYAFDYLLAPNASLEQSLQMLEESVQYVKETYLEHYSYGFCGRSAGSFLMLQLTKKAAQLRPDFLINFYGYTDLNFITTPRQLVATTIDQKEIQSINTLSSVWDDPFLERYLLYHYAVQNALLFDWYGLTPEAATNYFLTDAILATYPPCFSTASTTDKEIPFRYSKHLARAIPESQFVPLYYLEHDFLKKTEDPAVKSLLEKLDVWLQNRNNKKS
ncbi:hypothetical protein IGI37_000463 [Enterococcus sp. AZ194]|uniref:alpha/beta hydrolase n=1 Tax=Enterococcus sp. AZ194 TaxID=2774629 RepID=UPI003F28309E